MVAERLPPSIGGVEAHIAGITEFLRLRGHELTLVAPAASDKSAPAETVGDCLIIRFPVFEGTRRNYARAWQWWIRHRALIDAADVVHFHDVYALLHWFGPALLLRPKKPRYLTFHGYEMDYPIPLRARLYRKLAARLVLQSIAVGHYLPKWFDIRPHYITYGAVHIPEETFPLPPTHHALFVGRLARDTGIHIYLEGLRMLQDDHGISLPLTVCGDGPERESAEKHARALRASVTFLGFQATPERLYRESSIAFASGYLAMLEAMAHRRPVFSVFHNTVKSDYLTLIPESDTFFTISASPEELAAGLKNFMWGDVRLQRQIDDAFRFASGQTWVRLAETYETLWSAAL